jgi:SAM-dependent methyltransferase
VANAAEIASWDGPAGDHWVREAARYDVMLASFADAILAAAGPRPGERVLEVGCGTGALAVRLAGMVAPGGSVTGVDVSRAMLAVAARRAAGAGAAVEWVRADAQVHPFPADHDVVVSRFGVLFFEDPAAAFANLAAALRPGGRLAFACWQDARGNEWITVPRDAALAHVPAPPPAPEQAAPGPGPFSLADAGRLVALLTGAGLADVALETVEAPLRMGTSVDDVVEFYRRSEIAELIRRGGPEEQAAAWAAVHDALAARAVDGAVDLVGRAWLVTARRPA